MFETLNESCPLKWGGGGLFGVLIHTCTHSLNDMLTFSSPQHKQSTQVDARGRRRRRCWHFANVRMHGFLVK